MGCAVTINGQELEFSGSTAGNYNICLTALDENGGIATQAFTVTVGNPSSINNQWFSTLMIYPNPVEDILHIQKASSTFNVTIYSAHGSLQKAYKKLVNSVAIDLSDLPLGLYFIIIENPINGTFLVEKIFRKD